MDPSSTSNSSNSRNPWTHFDSNLWISIQLVFTLGQIIAAVVVLSVSRHEKPHTPLFAWVVVYMAACVATLPLIYWNWQRSRLFYTSNWVDIFAVALVIFFTVWFVVGTVWISKGHTSSSSAPNLYWLCVVFLTINAFWVVTAFVIVALIFYNLPYILSVLGVRENKNNARGASAESINALPKHKFKSKQTGSSSSTDVGGVIAEGTAKEHAISGQDAVCCICLAKYVDGDKLRELPCSHLFHTKCVDKWLKINASCPFCKYGIWRTPRCLH